MTNASQQVRQPGTFEWVPLVEMHVSDHAQRDLNPHRVNYLIANFNPEALGTPLVSYRDGRYYVLDGQHRVQAMRDMGWGDQQIECRVLTGLTEAQEAQLFLRHNDNLAVSALAKYKVGVRAGNPTETTIQRVVDSLGLVITDQKVEGAVRAVNTLRRILQRADEETLRRTLLILRDAYGDAGMEAAAIDGVALMVQRYSEQLSDTVAIAALRGIHGGVKGLLGRAEQMRRQTNQAKARCVAAAATEVVSRAMPRGQKLPNWWHANHLASVS